MAGMGHHFSLEKMKPVMKSIFLLTLWSICAAAAQDAAAIVVGDSKKEDLEQTAYQWEVTCEVFSLPLSEAAKLKRARLSEAEVYSKLVEKTQSGNAKQEEFLIVRTLSGSSASAQEITERIHPTDFSPPEFPSKIGNLPEDLEKAKSMVTPATPSAFDTTDEGSTLEIEVERFFRDLAEIKLDLTLTKLTGRQKWGQGVAEVETPRYVNQTIRTRLKAPLGQATLAGTLSPPKALQPEKGGKQTWLAFITVREAKD